MAARKRKVVQPKQADDVESEPELAAELATETGVTEAPETEPAPSEFPVAEAPPLEAEVEAEPEEDGAPDSESERVTLPPQSRVVNADEDEEPDARPGLGHELLGEGPSEVDESRVDDTGAYLKGLLEALLFVSDHPLEIKDLARAAKIDKKRVEELLQEIRSDFQNRGVRLDEVGDGFAFRSNPTYSEYVRGYLSLRPVRLSRAQLETLSIVAYRQPITRPEVDDIRGVDAGPVLKGLLERDLVRIIGKKDEPGRPMLYGTTQTFLQVFSLKSLRDLPTLREFTELNDESRKTFEEELGEEAPEGPISFEDAMAAEADLDAAGPSETEAASDALADLAGAEGAESGEKDGAHAGEAVEPESDDDGSDDDDESDDDESDDDDDESDDDDDESDDDDDDESDDDDDDESDDDDDDESDDDDDDDDGSDKDKPAEEK